MAEVQAGVLYVDTSALVKLVIREAESDVLEEELRRWSELVTSVTTSIELSRAVARARSDSAAVVADEYTILGVAGLPSERWARAWRGSGDARVRAPRCSAFV